jgi:glycosyltransferase involved in cell wall biosynthesis
MQTTAQVRAVKLPAYVLVTPVRNEEGTIPITIESVISQTILPKEWIIVSDGSTDRTDEIVRRHSAQHAFIRLMRLEGSHTPNFASVVHAIEAGCGALLSADYEYIGLLDADVRFAGDYYQQLIGKFSDSPKLGLAGGWVKDLVKGKLQGGRLNPKEVAGATQFFHRSCFESLGGLIAIPEGGWDAITCVRARMHGYETRTFPDVIMEHLKPRNSIYGSSIRRKWQMGARDYALGSHPMFETLKCLGRIAEQPLFLGALARLAGYVRRSLQGRQVLLPPELVRFIRDEQMARVVALGGMISSRVRSSRGAQENNS